MYTGRNTPFLSYFHLSRVYYTFSHKNAWIIIKTYVYPITMDINSNQNINPSCIIIKAHVIYFNGLCLQLCINIHTPRNAHKIITVSYSGCIFYVISHIFLFVVGKIKGLHLVRIINHQKSSKETKAFFYHKSVCLTIFLSLMMGNSMLFLMFSSLKNMLMLLQVN